MPAITAHCLRFKTNQTTTAMKKILIALLLTGNYVATAQEAEQLATKPLYVRKNELGLMGESHFNQNVNAGDISFCGIQYKHWVKPNMGYRLILAYGEFFENYYPTIQGKFGDTVIETSRQTTIPNVIAGLGVEMQRKFYKRVYLFAAVEARAGYGTGKYSYVTSERIENNQFNQYASTTFTPDAYARMFTVNVAPSIGAKIQFRSICFGTELSAIQLGYKNIYYSQNFPSYMSTSGFDAGMFRQRFFLHYRF